MNNIYISLYDVPGSGQSTHSVSTDTTLKAFLEARGLSHKQVAINGSEKKPETWENIMLEEYIKIDGYVEICTYGKINGA